MMIGRRGEVLGTVKLNGTFSVASDDAGVVGHGAAVCIAALLRHRRRATQGLRQPRW